jgi:RND superfamily putative drug exporter
MAVFQSTSAGGGSISPKTMSVAAAWGLLVLVWQHGWGSDAIWGIEATPSINVEMPIVVFAFLFGISMDYHVFIISRMREAYDRTGSTDAAVGLILDQRVLTRHVRNTPRSRHRKVS